MKKTLLTLALLSGVVCVNAQKVNEADVPAAVKTEFKSLYADVKEVKWEKEKSNYEGNFHNGKTEMSVTITAAGKLLETETAIDAGALPKTVADYLSKNLPGKKINNVSSIKDDSGKITYEAEVDGTDYTFDEKGNFLKKEKDND
ncbi:MAG TPA: PepSY-like domain-containing protein [Bacteroidia bacterium]|nr:PepSY-like domain-containing protein [Bacteroidia bacterium]